MKGVKKNESDNKGIIKFFYVMSQYSKTKIMQNRYCDITLLETEGTSIICCLVMHEFTKKSMNKSILQLLNQVYNFCLYFKLIF